MNRDKVLDLGIPDLLGQSLAPPIGRPLGCKTADVTEWDWMVVSSRKCVSGLSLSSAIDWWSHARYAENLLSAPFT